MFKKSSSLLVVLSMVLWLIGCSQSPITVVEQSSSDETNSTGTVSFQLGQAGSGINASFSASGSGAEITADAQAILVSIQNGSGELVVNKQNLSLYEANGQFLSQSLELPVGSYTLTEFLVIDGSNDIILAAPKENSELANNVNNPLPLPVVISETATATLTPEVIEINQENTLPALGYAAFSFEVVETFCFYVEVEAKGSQTDANLLVEGDGTTLYNNPVDSTTDKIIVKSNQTSYTLTISKEGYNTFTLNATQAELEQYHSNGALRVTLEVERQPAVYITGTVEGWNGPDNEYFPLFTVDGQEQFLQLESTNAYANESAVASNGDVYVVGVDATAAAPDERRGCYWVNGDKNSIPGAASADAIEIVNNVVYIAGRTTTGELFYMIDGVITNTQVTGYLSEMVVTDNQDIYLAYESSRTGYYWVNGVTTELPIPTTDDTFINGMAVTDNGSVYVVGYYGWDGVAAYWIDGVYYNIPELYKLTDVAVEENNVYMTGVAQDASYNRTGYLWTNGTLTPVSNCRTADALFVQSGNVYIVGSDQDQNAYYWLNDVPTSINVASSYERTYVMPGNIVVE